MSEEILFSGERLSDKNQEKEKLNYLVASWFTKK